VKFRYGGEKKKRLDVRALPEVQLPNRGGRGKEKQQSAGDLEKREEGKKGESNLFQ